MRRTTVVLIACVLAGCASSGGGGTGMTSDRLSGEARQVNANLITADEMASQSFTNVWQAIISLRPAWPKIPAYVRNGRMAFERLQEIPVRDVKEIRHLSREQARVRFGPEAQESILVVMK